MNNTVGERLLSRARREHVNRLMGGASRLAEDGTQGKA